ncbi:MAG: hypothetical protein J0G33_02850 [Afipia felis]|nr:hypothetical protein [Afipia felis]
MTLPTTAAGTRKELDLIIQAKECLETAIKLYECTNGNCNTVVQAIHWTNKARTALGINPNLALREIEAMPCSLVNDADSLRHTIKTMQAIARAAIAKTGGAA